MALLGGLFGGNSTLTSPKKGIANAQRGFNQQVKSIKEGSGNLKTYTGKANTEQEKYTNQSNDVLKDWYNEARKALQVGQQQGISYINEGVGQAAPLFNQASSLYAGLAPGDLAALEMYRNSLGLNGAGGNAAAVGAYQHNPGFQFALDEANRNVLRNNAAIGGVANGATLQALSDRAQGLQNQEYGGWQDRIAGLGENIYKDYTGQTGALQDLANLFTNAGANKANIATGTAAGLANNQTGLGSSIGSNLTGLGGDMATRLMALGGGLNQNNLAIGQASLDRAANINNAQQAAAQNSQASQQAWLNALGGLGGSIFSAAGKAGGFGSLFG